MRLIAFLPLLLLMVPELTRAQAGAFDLTFNGNGYNTTAVGNGDDVGQTLLQQPDGKILVAGESHSGLSADAAIVRYNADGTLDQTFGNNGSFTYAMSVSYFETIKGIALGSDGKITAVGYYFSPLFTFEVFLLRLNPDGTLDQTFGNGGTLSISVGAGSDLANAAAIQPDDKIVITGYYDNSGNIDIFVIRLNYDGTFDATFGGGDGLASVAIGSAEDYANALALQSDGKIVVAGKATVGSGTDFAVVRLNSDGTLDNTFSSDGKVTLNINGNDNGLAVALQSDGAIVVCGEAFDGSSFNVGVARFTASGVADNTFSGDGKLSTAVGSTYDGGFAVGIHANGKIIVGGLYATSTGDDMMLIRYTSTGTLDAGFGTNGIAKFNLGFNEAIYALAVLTSGKVLVAGKATNGSNADILVAKVISEFGVGMEELPMPALQFYPALVSGCGMLQLSNWPQGVTRLQLINATGQVVYQWDLDHMAGGNMSMALCLPSALIPGRYWIRSAQQGWAVPVIVME
ncbi:MAG: delta-60 repeat domain-containing protein [Chitinophagales bacterium]|nr:delta-60 repeat domain-containing protein [Chitinophagales bacterium]MDW8392816.1 delta-60 repeat domain-containing protein [Chitinophagales bacterium]